MSKPSPRYLPFANPYNCDVYVRFDCDSYDTVVTMSEYVKQLTDSVRVTDSRSHIVTVQQFKTINVEITVQVKLKWRKDVDAYRQHVEEYVSMLLPNEKIKELGLYALEVEVG